MPVTLYSVTAGHVFKPVPSSVCTQVAHRFQHDVIIPREAEGYSVELFGLSVRLSVRLSVCPKKFVRTSPPSCHLSANQYLYHMKAN